MNNGWKFAALGALGGAALSVVIIILLAAEGLLPGGNSDAKMHAYLLAHAEVLQEMTDRLQSDQQAREDSARQAAVDKLGMKTFFDPRVAFATGPKDARTTIVEFYDYDCPYCRASLPAMKKFYAAHKNDTRFSFIELPLPTLHGPGATLAAKASLAARHQPEKYVAFHFALMGVDGAITQDLIDTAAHKAGMDVAKLNADMANPVNDAEIGKARDLANAAKIDGTPAFIINGRMHEGALDDATLNQLTKQHV